MIRQRLSKWFHWLNLASDLIAGALALTAAYVLRFSGWPIPLQHDLPDTRLYLQALPVILAVLWLCYHYAGLYLLRRGISGVDELSRIVRGTTAAFLLVMAATFVYRQASYSRVVLLYAWAFCILLVFVSRTLLHRLQVSLRRRGIGIVRLALVGLTPTSRELAEHVRRHPGLGYKLIGVVATGPADSAWEGLKVLGAAQDLPALIEREALDEVIIALPAAAHGEIEELLLASAEAGAELKIVSDLFGMITQPLSVDEIHGVPVFALKRAPLGETWARALKRAFDLVCTVPAVLVLSPLLALLAIGVKLSSPGPVFYRQERVGRDNRTFLMLKFRTMRADAESQTGPVWAVKDDPRRTAFGTLLRRTSLDELPQLFNILTGDMSLVGPRPERPHFVEQFKTQVPRYLERHRVKAGLTGWAQANGLRGNTSIEERTKYDLWYAENWSLGLDIKILLRTALDLFHHTEAY